MKLKLLGLLLWIGMVGNAQDYIQMLDDTNVWNTDAFYSTFSGDYTITHEITIDGDIDFGGVIYKKIFNNDGESCYLREDNGLIYRYDEDNGTEFVLYDFTLELNDTFSLPIDVPFKCTYSGIYTLPEVTVTNVYTLNVAGEDRKIIEFDFSNPNVGQEIWIEGIGSYRGFEANGYGEEDWIYGTNLVCFTNNENSYFFNDATSCDNTTLGLTDIDKNSAVLFPNPVKNTSILQFAAEGIVDRVRLFNVSGKLVKEETVTLDYVLIDAMEYPSGLYFYQLLSEKKVIESTKFIIR